ncbi:MAG: HigA family addiction module antitoxin [Phormidesmis sp.]
MNKYHTISVRPGEVLQDELDELNISQTVLAAHIGVSPKTIDEICRGKREISATIAMQLSRVLGASPQFWLNLPNNCDLSQLDEAAYKDIKLVAG